MRSGLGGGHPRSNTLTSPPCGTHQAALFDPVGQPILEFLVGQVIHHLRRRRFSRHRTRCAFGFVFVLKGLPVSQMLPEVLDAGFDPRCSAR